MDQGEGVPGLACASDTDAALADSDALLARWDGAGRWAAAPRLHAALHPLLQRPS